MLPRLFQGSSWAVWRKPASVSGKQPRVINGAAFPSDEELVEYLLVSGHVVVVTGLVCCSVILPRYSHDAAAFPNPAGSGPTAANTAQSEDGPCEVPAVHTCIPAHQLPVAHRAALALML